MGKQTNEQKQNNTHIHTRNQQQKVQHEKVQTYREIDQYFADTQNHRMRCRNSNSKNRINLPTTIWNALS